MVYITVKETTARQLVKSEKKKIWQVRLCKNSTIRCLNIVRQVPIILHSPPVNQLDEVVSQSMIP